MTFARAASLLILPSTSFAEVCDKEFPNWSPTTGPVSQMEYFFNVVLSPVGITIMAVLIATCIFRTRWLAALGAAVVLFVGFAVLRIWMSDDGIYAASITEGCRASPILVLIGLSVAFFVFVVIGVNRFRPDVHRQ